MISPHTAWHQEENLVRNTVFLGVKTFTALSCASRVHFECLSNSRLFDEWFGEGRSSEVHGLGD